MHRATDGWRRKRGGANATPFRTYGSLTFETAFVALFSVNSMTLPA